VTSGSVTEPDLQGLVRPGGTYRNLLEGASVGDAFLRNTRWLKWQILNIGDPLYRPFGGGLPPFSPLQPVNSFMISPQEIVGGANSTGTITLSSAAPAGGTTFALTGGSGITVPATVTVAGGATKASFPITTTAVTSSQAVVLGADAGSIALQNTIITDPLLGGFLPAVKTTMAGYPVSVTAALNGRAPAGGATISLSSDNPAITVPATVTVPAGTLSTTFTVSSLPVSSAVTATITGTYAGASVPFSITVVPGLASFTATPSTISAGGSTLFQMGLGTNVPAGNTATVQLSSSDPVSLPVPATVTVSSGSYANFSSTAAPGSSGRSVTVSATYGGSTLTATVTIN